IPVPGDAGLAEGRVEGAAMDALGLGERAVDVEDQHRDLRDVILYTAGVRRCQGEHDIHVGAAGASDPPEKTRLASTSAASMVMRSSLERTRSSTETSRLAWRSRIRSSALRMERAFENNG